MMRVCDNLVVKFSINSWTPALQKVKTYEKILSKQNNFIPSNIRIQLKKFYFITELKAVWISYFYIVHVIS